MGAATASQKTKAAALLKQAAYTLSAFAQEVPADIQPQALLAKQATVTEAVAPEGQPVTSGGYFINLQELRGVINALGPA